MLKIVFLSAFIAAANAGGPSMTYETSPVCIITIESSIPLDYKVALKSLIDHRTFFNIDDFSYNYQTVWPRGVQGSSWYDEFYTWLNSKDTIKVCQNKNGPLAFVFKDAGGPLTSETSTISSCTFNVDTSSMPDDFRAVLKILTNSSTFSDIYNIYERTIDFWHTYLPQSNYRYYDWYSEFINWLESNDKAFAICHRNKVSITLAVEFEGSLPSMTAPN